MCHMGTLNGQLVGGICHGFVQFNARENTTLNICEHET